MLPLSHGTWAFPYGSSPCQLGGKTKPNSPRIEKTKQKQSFISFKNNIKRPKTTIPSLWLRCTTPKQTNKTQRTVALQIMDPVVMLTPEAE